MNLLKKDRRISRAMASSKRRISKLKTDIGSINSLNYPTSKKSNNSGSNLITLDRWKEDVEDPPERIHDSLTGLTYFMDAHCFFFVFIPHKTHKDDIIVFKLYNGQLYVAQMGINFVEKWKSESSSRKSVNRSSSFSDLQSLKRSHVSKRSQSVSINREELRDTRDLFYSLQYDRVGLIKFCKVIDMTQENDQLNSFLLTNKNYIFYLQALNSISKRKFTNLIYYYGNLQYTKISRFVGDEQLQQGNSISKVVEKNKDSINKTIELNNKLNNVISAHSSEINKLKGIMVKYIKYEEYLSTKTTEAIDKIKNEFAPLSKEHDALLSDLRSMLDDVDHFITQTRNDVDSKMKDALSRLSGFRSNLISINEKQDKYRRRAMLVSFIVGIAICFLTVNIF